MYLVNDFNTTVRKAFDEIDPHWEDYKGLVVCGTHSPDIVKTEETIEKLQWARETGFPTLGICFGYQLMAIEYARNVLKQPLATSEEFGTTGDFVVVKLPQLHVGLHNGQTYWHNYEVLEGLRDKMYHSKDPFYYGVQYHPEYQSSKDKPHSLLVEFLDYAKRYSKI